MARERRLDGFIGQGRPPSRDGSQHRPRERVSDAEMTDTPETVTHDWTAHRLASLQNDVSRLDIATSLIVADLRAIRSLVTGDFNINRTNRFFCAIKHTAPEPER
jgi:hypothetical protein